MSASARRERKVRLVLFVAALIVGALIRPLPAFAAFGHNNVASNGTFSTMVLLPPSTLNMSTGGSIAACYANLSWTIPSSGTPTGWVVQRYKGGTASGNAVTLTGTTTSYRDDLGLTLGSTYQWKIYGVAGSWTSTVTSSSSDSIGIYCQ